MTWPYPIDSEPLPRYNPIYLHEKIHLILYYICMYNCIKMSRGISTLAHHEEMKIQVFAIFFIV